MNHTLASPRIDSLSHLVGGTPLLEIRTRLRGKEISIWAKYEATNFTGSIKDRMALHILEEALASGELRPGAPIVEASGGNSAIAFAALGRALGHPVRLFTPDWLSRERQELLKSLGAELVPVSASEGGFLGAIARAEAVVEEEPSSFLPRPYENPASVAAHRQTTGPEILAQLESVGLQPTAFVAGVGTGGTVMGVGECLHATCPGVAIHPLEPADAPTLRSGAHAGHHRIRGIGGESVPRIVDLGALDAIVDVWDGDAIVMAQRLARELGLGVGISSGANLIGALKIAAQQGDGAVVATVLPDGNRNYLGAELGRTVPPEPRFLAPQVELLSFKVVPGQSQVVADHWHL